MDEFFTTSPNRQISGHLVIMTFIFVLLLSFVFSVAYIKEEQLNQQNAEQSSQLKQQISYQQALIKTSTLLEKTLSDNQTSSFQQDNQKLMTQWSILNGMLASNSLQFTLWLADNQKSQDIITRIVSRSEDNRQLLIQTVEQLKKTNEILTHNISKKNLQLKKSYQLVIKDNVNNSVTVNRAKDHIKASIRLEKLKRLNEAFETTIDGFEQLTIKTSSIKFEELSQQVLTTLSLHEFLVADSNTTSPMVEVNEHVEVLKLLLLVEEQTLAKWRSYLWLINGHRVSLQKQFDALQGIISQAFLNQSQYARIKSINDESLSVQINQTLTTKQQVIVFWFIFLAFLLSFICVVISLNHKVKVNQHKNIEVLTTDIPKNVDVKKSKFVSIIDDVLTAEIPKNVDVKKSKFVSIIDDVLTADIPKNVDVKKSKFESIIDEDKTYFNMALYTKNHGTFELALYMLDEYIESNDASFNELCNSIKGKNKPSAEQALMVLMQNARILAAEKLIALTLQLEANMVKQTFDKIGEVLLLTKYELAAIKKHASSI